jgi:hypothetical protein
LRARRSLCQSAMSFSSSRCSPARYRIGDAVFAIRGRDVVIADRQVGAVSPNRTAALPQPFERLRRRDLMQENALRHYLLPLQRNSDRAEVTPSAGRKLSSIMLAGQSSLGALGRRRTCTPGSLSMLVGPFGLLSYELRKPDLARGIPLCKL